MNHAGPVDVSFLLATFRPVDEFAYPAIKSIYDTDKLGMTYEIIVVSPNQVSGEAIRWVNDPAPGTGGVHAYNLAYQESIGDYIIPMVDDLLLHPRVLELVNHLKGPLFHNKRFKIVCMQTVNPGPFWIEPPLPRFPMACFPVLAREMIEKEFGGFLLNPQFTHGAADHWVGYWPAAHGEPALWWPLDDNGGYQLHELAVAACNTDQDANLVTLRRLYSEHQSGQRTTYAP